MKFIRRLVWSLLILFFAVVLISVETDFFANIKEYIPNITDRFPMVAELSEDIEDMTEGIPSFSQILASLRREPLPVDSEDFAKGSYNRLSPMLNFYADDSVGVLVKEGRELSVFGISKEKEKSNILIVLTDKNGEEIYRTSVGISNLSYEFQKNIKIPKTESDTMVVNIYTGEKAYGEFESLAIDYIYLEKVSDKWQIKKSPVADHNRSLYQMGKSISGGLKTTNSIRPENEAIKSVAKQLTSGIDNNYDKLLAIHDWVTGYLYYNIDCINDSKIAPYVDTEVLKSRKVVCLGYSNLFASLCRSVGIPCYVVSGYALGVDSADTRWNDNNYLTEEPNHAWNEAYVNGRWIIIDTTWDSFNKFEDGKMIKAEKNSHLYFDANPEFFSANHKIIKYLKD